VQDYPRWRRRQTLVNRGHQIRFTSILLLQMVAVISAIAAFAYVESRAALELALRHVVDEPVPSFQLHLNNQSFLLKIIAVIGVTALTQVLFGIYASHKLAGPVLKMSRVLDQAAGGDFRERVHFRRGDHLEELAGSLNRLLDGLAEEQARARAEADEIERQIQRLRERPSAAVDDLQELRERIARLAGVEVELPAGCGS
jgi:methyl-accepting chemotaxis protein